MVVAVWKYIYMVCHTHSVFACGGCQWEVDRCSKCTSADVGVEKERIWRSVSAWIN
jgi:hypothetical protein